MDDVPNLRGTHPCVSRLCGHATEAHTRTPELESTGETVLWCADCHRHEVRAARRPWLQWRVRPRPGTPSSPRAS